MYATYDDLAVRYGEDTLAILTDPSKTGTPDRDTIQQALEDAGEEIDSYIRQRYDLPLPQLPRLLVRIESDIAIYRLSESDSESTTEARKRYEDAVAMLSRISKGELSLGLEGPRPPVAREIRADSAPRRFDRRSMRGAFI